jgi:hypothetical protein
VRFRWTIAPTYTRHGDWCDDVHQAWEDALRHGLAHREDYPGAPIFLDELVEIEQERG